MEHKVKNTVFGLVQLVIIIGFIGTAIIASSVLKSSKPPLINQESQDRVLFVEATDVQPEPYRISFTTTGVVASPTNIHVISQVSGRVIVTHRDFYAGGSFKKGETLFQIEPRDFALEVQRLEAEVARAGTALDLEKAEQKAATEEWRLLNGSTKTVPELVARVPQLKEAEANLKAAWAQLDNARLAFKRSTFSFPFDGRVLSSTVHIGQFITAGQSYGEVFDLSALEIQTSLDENQLKLISAEGTPDIQVTLTHNGQDKNYAAYIKRGASSLNTETRFASITLGIKGDTTEILPGTFATIGFTTSEKDNITIVPGSAIDKNGILWTVQPDNTLKAFTPNILYRDNETVALDNVTETLSIVTSRLSGALDGAKVTLRNNKGEE